MRVGRRQFPYPVINNDVPLSKYQNSTFSLMCDDFKQFNDKLIVENACYESSNESLQELIYENKAAVSLIVECSSTIYREKFEITESPKNIAIPIHKLNGKVVISAYAYTKELIKDYQDDDFLEDYQGYSFDIEPYDILAIDDGYTTKVTHQEDEDTRISSIFLVIKDITHNDEKIRVDESIHKINILVPERVFDIYDNLKSNSYFQNLFYSLLIIPALSKVIKKLQGSEFDEIELNYNWFQSITEAYKNIYNEELDSEKFQNLDALVFAQDIMDSPVSKSFQDIYNLTNSSIYEEEEDE